MQNIKRLAIIAVAFALGETVPYGFAKYFSSILTETFTIDGYFGQALIHRTGQFLITLILIRILLPNFDLSKNFSFKKIKDDLMRFKVVIIIWPLLVIAFFYMATYFVSGFDGYLVNLYPRTLGWFMGRAGRDLFLLDAFSEEILYRALIIGILSLVFKGTFSVGKISLSVAALISVPIFAIAHVQIGLIPLEIISYDWIQLILTVGTGLLFAYAYEKTENLLVSVVLHGYTNLIITLSAYALIF